MSRRKCWKVIIFEHLDESLFRVVDAHHYSTEHIAKEMSNVFTFNTPTLFCRVVDQRRMR